MKTTQYFYAASDDFVTTNPDYSDATYCYRSVNIPESVKNFIIDQHNAGIGGRFLQEWQVLNVIHT